MARRPDPRSAARRVWLAVCLNRKHHGPQTAGGGTILEGIFHRGTRLFESWLLRAATTPPAQGGRQDTRLGRRAPKSRTTSGARLVGRPAWWCLTPIKKGPSAFLREVGGLCGECAAICCDRGMGRGGSAAFLRPDKSFS